MSNEDTGVRSSSDEDRNLNEPAMIEVARWQAGGVTGDKHRLTIQQNGDSWLVLKQRKLHKTWKVEESWHADHQPAQASAELEGGVGE